jgi:hypothetical protein
VSPRRLDLPRIGVASGVAAALALGLAVAFLRHARSTPDLGPTAATLDEASSLLLGAALGLALGGALGALIVWRGPRVGSGLLVGLLAYAFVLAPVFVSTDDASLGEDLNPGGLALLVLLAVPLGALAALGAAVGDVFARFLRGGHDA